MEAEVAAFPIASEASFRLALVCLDPVTSRQKNLSRAAERDILLSIPSVPLEEFVAIRDKLWFGVCRDWVDRHEPPSLVRYLRWLPEQYLDALGRPVDASSSGIGNDGPSPRARVRWGWLCRALPPDLLRAAGGIRQADDSPFPLSAAVDRLLRESGYAETHLHLGAGADFPLLWANFMHALAVEEIREDSLGSPGARFGEGREFAKWILWAAVVRLVLAEWLFDADRSRQQSELRDFTTATMAQADAWRDDERRRPFGVGV